MKLLLSLILLVGLPGAIYPQSSVALRCPYKGPQVMRNIASESVGDFTITTTDGITRNLYATLDSGKTVFIDLFYTTCYWCQYYSPIIEEIYQNHGAGQGGIEFWGISSDPQDSDPVIDTYRQNYNITNPCAGPQGGGTAAHNTVISGQNFLGWPTYCVVCPDRTMFFDPCYPPTVNGFDPYFETCAAMVGTENLTSKTETSLVVYPNPARERIILQIQNKLNGTISIEMYNVMGINVLSSFFTKNEDKITLPLEVSVLPEGTYLLRLIQGQQVLHSEKVSIVR